MKLKVDGLNNQSPKEQFIVGPKYGPVGPIVKHGYYIVELTMTVKKLSVSISKPRRHFSYVLAHVEPNWTSRI